MKRRVLRSETPPPQRGGGVAAAPPGAHAFTLIELLVVLSIVALLIALLLPTLGSARRAAHASACLSNQRQTAIALLAYTGDNQGECVTYVYDGPRGRVWWFGLEPGGPTYGSNRPLDKSGSPLAPYFGGDIHDGLACAAFPRGDDRFVAKFDQSSAHFGYNGGVVWPFPLGRAARRIDEIANPSGVFAFADAVHQDFGSSFYEPHTVSYRRPGKTTGTGHYRHAGAAQLVYFDGHAAAQPPPDGEPVWDTVADAPLVNLDTADGPRSAYGFKTWTAP